MSDPNSGDPIGDAPDADPELTRNRSGGGAAAVWRVVTVLVIIALIIALIMVFL
ncbi:MULTISPECIES: hypothetical protein [unclassified Rhodococcus (in: high G+C Gram-positive bacteria)]|jgi:hypothetical protein|uniref:hypothetical protein n=1 Tax=unclassified Rhodococcus (in: high G+C Gram-positive bacteria) TaxID=192944 RepID=UPI00146E2816|nr:MULTISPECIES: hypothetical protein [unclassified Rhodococcus (in: high G+C Gram-positive bacteria)]MBF0663072.1 hypothetical protein [Rhodococcus sp. (in: high G+C Gram-positive bacteria)]NMD96237.1 hypothetical protein [Rhodococcus sp. BL-253-APC-6A1W]NME80018.1 hypothetical protein [Rhodococcus sp. 105337]